MVSAKVTAPAVSWLSSPSISVRVPGQGLLVGVIYRLVQGVTDPLPASPHDTFHWLVSHLSSARGTRLLMVFGNSGELI